MAEPADGTCMQGWQTRDRRKPHIIKADEEADALAAQLTDADTDGELPISCKHALSSLLQRAHEDGPHHRVGWCQHAKRLPQPPPGHVMMMHCTARLAAARPSCRRHI